MPPEPADNQAFCSECGVGTDTLFSHRPVHRRSRETLLICVDCAARAQRRMKEGHGGTVRCAWCGDATMGATTDSGREICQNCISFCLLAER